MPHLRALPAGLIALACGLAAVAQNPEPASSEQALRERITRFFQAHVDGKPRQAMPLVAEDSQDYFFGLEKPKYLAFEIASIKIAEDGKTAVAVVNCENEIEVAMFGRQKVKAPRITRWRLENGEWMWYATEAEKQNPKLPPPAPVMPGAGLAAAPNASNLPAPGGTPVGAAARLGILSDVSKLHTDKNSVTLQAGKPSSDAITVTNPMPGWVTVEAWLPEVPGLAVKIDKKDIPPNGTSQVRFEYTPAGPLTKLEHQATINVVPMNRRFPVRIVFQPAPAETAKPAPPAKPAGKTAGARRK